MDSDTEDEEESVHTEYESIDGLEEILHRYNSTPVIDFWIDWEKFSAEEIANPWEFFDEFAAIEKYEHLPSLRFCS